MDLLGTGFGAHFGNYCATIDDVTFEMTVIFIANAMRTCNMKCYIYFKQNQDIKDILKNVTPERDLHILVKYTLHFFMFMIP
jgi:hypothetical protein